MNEKETNLLEKIELLEIPSDVLLYWTLRGIGFHQVVTNKEINVYREAICKAYETSGLSSTLVFHDPFSYGYNQELFRQVRVKNNLPGITLKKAKKQRDIELQQLRLTKLECFSRKNGKKIEKLFFSAYELFKQDMIGQELLEYDEKKESPIKKVKKKVLQVPEFVKAKFHN